ncbi:MAG: AraC family transcriptional regulator [Armatimonadetes bacterium]|nr:AraC family transcriptional regulator [Armatimonadota bacterium]MDW8121712.1 AraC family transcriptional regulator [Armatimonadota bacterium]
MGSVNSVAAEPRAAADGNWHNIVTCIETHLLPQLEKKRWELIATIDDLSLFADPKATIKKEQKVLYERVLGPGFLFVVRGSLILFCESKHLPLRAVQGVFFPERTVVGVGNDSARERREWLQITVDRFGTSVRKFTQTGGKVFSGIPYLITERTLAEIYRLWCQEVAERGEKTVGSVRLLGAFLTVLARSVPTTPFAPLPPSLIGEQSHPVVSKAARLLHQSYDMQCSLGALSRECGVSKEHLCRLFKKVLGLTPWQYLQRLRLEAACQMLKETEWRISDIAAHSGFGDLRHFQRIFRRSFHRSPLAYRRAVRRSAAA